MALAVISSKLETNGLIGIAGASDSGNQLNFRQLDITGGKVKRGLNGRIVLTLCVKQRNALNSGINAHNMRILHGGEHDCICEQRIRKRLPMVHGAQLCKVKRVNRCSQGKRRKVVRTKEKVLVNENSLRTRDGNLRNYDDAVGDKLTVLLVEHVSKHLHRHNSVNVSRDNQQRSVGKCRKPSVSTLSRIISRVVTQLSIHGSDSSSQLLTALNCRFTVRCSGNIINMNVVEALEILIMLQQVEHKYEFVILV